MVEQKSGIVVVQDKDDLVDCVAGIDWHPGTAGTEDTEQCRKGARVVGTVDGSVLAALITGCKHGQRRPMRKRLGVSMTGGRTVFVDYKRSVRMDTRTAVKEVYGSHWR